jgi:hypothetical protein
MKYRPAIFVIWHHDPEKDGTDDSCGWSAPKLTKRQRSRLEHLAYDEARNPWFQRDPVKRITSPADAESLMRGAIQMVARVIKAELTWEEICQMACRLTHNTADNFQGSLCHLPGWHTNFKEDMVSEREWMATGFFCNIARLILRHKRRWWQHPRWHFWHWKIQVYPLLSFKRWMWSRCEYCGKGFGYGEAPCTHSWHGTGPLWFRSEKYVHHSQCTPTSVQQPVKGSSQ